MVHQGGCPLFAGESFLVWVNFKRFSFYQENGHAEKVKSGRSRSLLALLLPDEEVNVLLLFRLFFFGVFVTLLRSTFLTIQLFHTTWTTS